MLILQLVCLKQQFRSIRRYLWSRDNRSAVKARYAYITIILYCVWGYLTTSDHQMYNVALLYSVWCC
jgi:hypothetical protein